MANLFERGGLQQDTGLLKQRWAQEGSVLVNISDGLSTNTTLHTVTTGKVLYIDTLYLSNGSGVVCSIGLRDGGAAGDYRFLDSLQAVLGDSHPINLETPLIFETDVFFEDIAGADDVWITMSGWEEDA